MGKLLRSLFRRPSVQDMQSESGPELHRHLGKWSLMSLGIACIIGTGIFVMTGNAASTAGPAVIFSFLVAGITCLFTALNYSEIAQMFPNAGSAYTYARASMGEYPGWTIGWDLLLEYCVGSAAVAAGWSAYMQFIMKNFGITLPTFLQQAPHDMPWLFVGAAVLFLMFGGLSIRTASVSGSARWTATVVAAVCGAAAAVNLFGTQWAFSSLAGSSSVLPYGMPWSCLWLTVLCAVLVYTCVSPSAGRGGVIRWVASLLGIAVGAGYAVAAITHITSVDILAVFVISFLSLLLMKGVKETAWAAGIFVVIKLFVIGAFILICMPYVEPGHWQPFMPNGWGKVMQASVTCFFAYIGFDTVSVAAREAKNPQKDLPFGIVGSLIVCGALYIAVAAVMTGVMFYSDLGGNLEAAPMAKVLEHIGSGWLASGLVTIGALAGITSVLVVCLYGQSRITMTKAHDGLLPPMFGKVHPQTKTPIWSIAIWGAVSAAMAGLIPMDDLANLVSIGTLFAFLLVCAAVIILRHATPASKSSGAPTWASLVCVGVAIGLGVALSMANDSAGFMLVFVAMAFLLVLARRVTPFPAPDSGRGYVAPTWSSYAGIMSVVYMMSYVNVITWARCVVWLVFGTIIYLNYGRQHSVLARQADSEAKNGIDA